MILHTSGFAEDAYWPKMVSPFRVTSTASCDFVREKICSYHQYMYAEPQWNKNRNHRVSQKMPKITCFFGNELVLGHLRSLFRASSTVSCDLLAEYHGQNYVLLINL